MIEVHNDGAPIPANLLPTIFDPLSSGAAAGANRPGSIGLGLYIAHQVVTSHGGFINVASSAGAGTTFTVHLPRTSRQPQQRDS